MRRFLLLAMLLIAVRAQATEIIHPPGGGEPISGLPIPAVQGGTGVDGQQTWTDGRCIQVGTDAEGKRVLQTTPAACGIGAGSSAFSFLTSGTNTTASMIVGSGAYFAPSGTGTVLANQFAGTLPIASGGTNATSLTANRCVRFDGTRLVSATGDCADGDTTTLVAGTFIDVTGSTISVDPTEMSYATFGDDTQSTMTWAFDPIGPKNPTLTFVDHTISFGNSTVIFFEDDPIVIDDLDGNGVQFDPPTAELFTTGTGNIRATNLVCPGCVDTADLAPTGVTGTTCTSCDLTYDASGRIVSAANGTGGAVTAGNAIDVTAGVVDFDPTELTNVTVSDGASATASTTYNLSGANDPKFTAQDGGFSIAASGNPLFRMDDTDQPNGATPDWASVIDCLAGPACSYVMFHSITGGVLSNILTVLRSGPITLGDASVPSVTLATTGTGDGAVVLPASSIGATELVDSGVTGTTCTNCNLTYDADGRITAAANGSTGGGKSLVDNTPTALVNFTLAADTSAATIVRYVVDVVDTTNHKVQSEVGTVLCQVINSNGTLLAGGTSGCTKVAGSVNTVTAASGGTLAVTWTMTAANPAVLTINADTATITPAAGYPRVTYVLDNLTNQAVAVL